MRKWEQFQEAKSELLPRLIKLQAAVKESAEKFGEVDLMKLRPVEEALVDWAGFTVGLQHLKTELKGMSPASAIAVFVVGLKVIRVLNKIIDVALAELLSRQGIIARLLLVHTSCAGWAAVYGYWGAITRNLDAVTDRGVGVLEGETNWLVQLIRNLKRLPAIFWYSTMVSSLISLQQLQTFGKKSMRLAARSLYGSWLLQIVGCSVGLVSVYVRCLTQDQIQELQSNTRRLLAGLASRLPSIASFNGADLQAGTPSTSSPLSTRETSDFSS